MTVPCVTWVLQVIPPNTTDTGLTLSSDFLIVISKINDSEGGLEEIFQKYKNSGQLLNDWIIKTVEKAMFRNRSEARRLEEMLESLVQEVVENERFIVEKQLLDGFLGTFREQVEALAGLLKGLDEQKKLTGQLAALYGYLTAETGSLQGKYEENELEMGACKAEEQRVQLEERSNGYWLRQSEYQEALKKLQAAETMSSATDGALQEAKVREKIMRAARLAEEICRKRSELSGIEESLSTSREQYDTDGRVRGLPPEIRQTMLEGNPVLPYAFIMSRTDLDRVANSASSMTMRRVIPLIAYEDLGTTVPSDGRVARTRDGIALACLYEGRMFDNESLVKLVAELEQKRNAALEQHGHLTDAHTSAVSDRAVYARFDLERITGMGWGKREMNLKSGYRT